MFCWNRHRWRNLSANRTYRAKRKKVKTVSELPTTIVMEFLVSVSMMMAASIPRLRASSAAELRASINSSSSSTEIGGLSSWVVMSTFTDVYANVISDRDRGALCSINDVTTQLILARGDFAGFAT